MSTNLLHKKIFYTSLILMFSMSCTENIKRESCQRHSFLWIRISADIPFRTYITIWNDVSAGELRGKLKREKKISVGDRNSNA